MGINLPPTITLKSDWKIDEEILISSATCSFFSKI
jgi:hypothetical protein